jgi:hypothetical protein
VYDESVSPPAKRGRGGIVLKRVAVEVRDGVVVFAAPQPTLADALARAGLTEDDRIFKWEPEESDPAQDATS